MVDITARIQELEKELSGTKYNKATQHHFAIVKAQIAKLREKQEKRSAGKGGGTGFAVKKSGDATVVLLGFPSVGKSTLLNALTGAKSKVAAYEFTTLDVIPGLLEYNQAKIQVLDVPGILCGASQGKGRGREVLAVVRSSDLILITVDANHPEQHEALLKELFDAGVRVNARPPDVKIVRKLRGGIDINTTVKLTKVTPEAIEAVLREFRLNNCGLVIRDDIDLDQLIDAIEGNRSYIPAVLVITKVDLLPEGERRRLAERLVPDAMVSAEQGLGVDALREAVFQRLGFIRLFLKEVGKRPDLDEPMILRKGATLQGACERIHRDFVKRFRFAKIWGPSAKFPGQQFRNLDKPLADGDIIEIHTS
jgi:hypothetical protein